MRLVEEYTSPWTKHGQIVTGLWRAVVINNNDGEKRGRLQVRILHLHPPPLGSTWRPVGPEKKPEEKVDTDGTKQGEITGRQTLNSPGIMGIPDGVCPWADPAFPFGGSTSFKDGCFFVPSVGSSVWVGFEMGSVSRPIWLGSWLGVGDAPVDWTNPDKVRLIRTPGGHTLLFDDTSGATKVALAVGNGASYTTSIQFLKFSKTGTLQEMTLQNGTTNVGSRIYSDGLNLKMTQGNVLTDARTLLSPTSATLAYGPVASPSMVVCDSGGILLVAGTSTISLSASGNCIINNAGNSQTLTQGSITQTAVGGAITFNDAGFGFIVNSLLATLNAVTMTLGPTGLAIWGAMLSSICTKFNTHTHTCAAPGAASSAPTGNGIAVAPGPGVNLYQFVDFPPNPAYGAILPDASGSVRVAT